MLTAFKKLMFTLDTKDRREVAALLSVMVMTAIMESLGIVSILPFLAILSDPAVIHSNKILTGIYTFLGFTDDRSFLFFAGFAVLGIVVLSNTAAAFLNWKLSYFTHMRAHVLSLRILRIYMYLPYDHFLRADTSDMAKNVLTEVSHVSKNLFVAGMQAVSRIIVSLLILGILIATDPVLALSVGGVLILAYIIIYIAVHRKLHRIGEERLQTTAERYKILAEVLKGIKDIRLTGTESKYIATYEQPSILTSRSYAQYDMISLTPRYVFETIAFAVIIMVIFYLMSSRDSIIDIVPTLGLYAIAGQRLLPALQNIFLNLTKLRFGIPSLYNLVDELKLVEQVLPSQVVPPMNFVREVSVRDVTFAFGAGQAAPTLDHVSITIQKGQRVAFVGSTGAGKSTLIDIMSGLLQAQQGGVYIDDVHLTPENSRAWQQNIGYVSQNIFLFNDSFERNIAIGEGDTPSDRARVEAAAKIAQLHDFITTQSVHGYETIIGENGIRLSGGQRQRLGLARALYANRPVLILDEATSALDNITEKAVMDSLAALPEKKTIIMIAHRLSTVKDCDKIFFMENGRVLAQGTYDELQQTCPQFLKLSEVSKMH